MRPVRLESDSRGGAHRNERRGRPARLWPIGGGWRPAGLAMGLLLVIAFLGSTYAWSEAPQDRVRSAADALYAWLDAGGQGAPWREYLRHSQLEAQLAKGETADPKAVLDVLSRFGTGAPGLEQARFVEVRQALVQWLTALPGPSADELPAAARAAKAAFLPHTQTDLEVAKGDLLSALERLDARLKAGGARGADWRAYLKLETVEQQLARQDAPDLGVLDAAYLRLAAGYEGLGLVWFADLRQALRQYLTTARAIGQTKLRGLYEGVLEKLAGHLEAYRKTPSAEVALTIHAELGWLEQAGQAQWLVRAIRRRLSHPNLFAEVSSGLVASQLAGPVDDTSPVRDCILGTDIHGTGHTTGKLSVELVPSEEAAQLDLVFQGQIATDTIGYNGPAQIFATGTTQLGARKRLTIDAERVSASPAVSQAETSTTINGIADVKQRAIVERIASRRVAKQKGQAECIAARHAEDRFNERMDQQADDLIARENQRLRDKLRRPLVERRLFPEVLRFRTTRDSLQVLLLQAAGGALAAPAAPPEVSETADVAVRLHESAVNNFTTAALGGMLLEEKRFQELLTETVGLPPPKGTPEDKEEWSITFAPRQPIWVKFGDGGFTVTVSGSRYTADGKPYPGMNITAAYKIEKTDRGLKAVRQGDLVIFPPGFSPESGGQLSAREQVLRTMLDKRFGKFFEKQMTPKNVVVTAEGREPLELSLTRWETARGWLVLAWKKVPPSKPEKTQ